MLTVIQLIYLESDSVLFLSSVRVSHSATCKKETRENDRGKIIRHLVILGSLSRFPAVKEDQLIMQWKQ
jgi:hypothetical protein